MICFVIKQARKANWKEANKKREKRNADSNNHTI